MLSYLTLSNIHFVANRDDHDNQISGAVIDDKLIINFAVIVVVVMWLNESLLMFSSLHPSHKNRRLQICVVKNGC